jgi:ABC-type uncharacterized transport system auxiliary subunit
MEKTRIEGDSIKEIEIIQNKIDENDHVLIRYKNGKIQKIYASTWFDNPILLVE